MAGQLTADGHAGMPRGRSSAAAAADRSSAADLSHRGSSSACRGSRAQSADVVAVAASGPCSGPRRDPGRRSSVVAQRLAGEAPQHGAQLGVLVQAHAVVEAPEPRRPSRTQVRPLAVGVVDHRVERRHAADVVAVLVDHAHGPAAARPRRRSTASQPVGDRAAARRGRPADSWVDGVDGSPTHRCTDPGPSGPSRSTVCGHDVPAAGRADQVDAPPRGRPASRRGSPTAAARRGPACRSVTGAPVPSPPRDAADLAQQGEVGGVGAPSTSRSPRVSASTTSSRVTAADRGLAIGQRL